jgi:heat shock protein HslJ
MLKTLALTLLLQVAGVTPPLTSAQPTMPLYQGVWIVEVVDKIKVMPDSRVTMRIEGGTVAGLASCNTYRGSFTVTGTSIKVGELLRTMKACDPPRLSEENDFLAVLREVVRYEVQSGDTLELKTPDGKTIVATRER